MMRLGLIAAGLAFAASMPLLAGEFWVTLLSQIMIFGLLALSADLLLGNAGLFSLCHASFFAVAAYTTAILQVRYGASTALAAPAGILAGTALSFLFAFAVRTRGVYFILITLAFGYIIWGVAYRWASFTGGDNGVTNVPFPHIMRAKFMQIPTIIATAIWIGGIAWGTIALPDRPYAVRPLLYIGCGYFIALSVMKMVHDYRMHPHPQAATEP